MNGKKIIKINDHLSCRIDGEKFKTANERNVHIKNIHNLSLEEYLRIYYFNGKYPECTCGCGIIILPAFRKDTIQHSYYTTNHFERKKHSEESKQKIRIGVEKTLTERYGVSNVMLLKNFKDKIKKTKEQRYGDENYNNLPKQKSTMMERYGVDNGRYLVKKTKTSDIEIKISQELNAKHKFIYQNKEFDMILGNNIIEVEGDYWHPAKLENLTLSQINSVINDKQKIDIIKKTKYNLYKIHISNLPDILTLESIKLNSYAPDYSISDKQIIISNKYFKKYIQTKGKQKLHDYSYILLKFIQTFQPLFPYPSNFENINTIINRIVTFCNCDKIVDKDKIYSNKCSSIGSDFLKGNFNSYWSAKFYNSISPVEAWQDNKTMQKVIEYRIGCNNSNEVFDFTLHQLICGLSARRITTSWFKPMLAAVIYKQLLGNKEKPTVLDPCAGYGARLLAFKSLYPAGTYIGVEPNKQTFDELNELVTKAKFTNIILHNCKIEDLDINFYYDVAFTSIPYFNTEIYSNNTKYNSYEEWVDVFIAKIKSLSNAYINMSYDLAEKLDLLDNNWKWICNSTSHYNTNTNVKLEPIVKMY